MVERTPEQEKWLAGWDATSVRLAQLRRQELAHVDVGAAIEALDDAFESALAHAQPSHTSGLVQQQAWFMRGRR